VEQGVAGDQRGTDEVVEEQVDDRAAVPLGGHCLVELAAEPGTDAGAEQGPQVGSARGLAGGVVDPDVHHAVRGALEAQGQRHLPEDLRPVGVVAIGAEITAPGVDDQRSARPFGADGVDRRCAAHGSGRARRRRRCGSVRAHHQPGAGHRDASTQPAEALGSTALPSSDPLPRVPFSLPGRLVSDRAAAHPPGREGTMPDYEFVTYETLDDGAIARIMLNRPEARNAQNRGLLVDLGDALLQAEADDRVRVVILGGMGPMFSSGHDMGSKQAIAERTPGPTQHPTVGINGGTRQGAEALMLQEWHYYFDNTRRWRNLRKITIAQVHGTVYAAGLMLMWACDLIVAAEDAKFADVVGARLGMCGVEYFAHPWEFGPRKTKELMLTGDSIDAREAHQLGMVSKLFPEAELGERTLEFARRIAQLPTMTALLIKESVNQTVDNMGFHNALNACFTLHELNHSHWAQIHENKYPVALPEDGIPDWRSAPPVKPSRPDLAEAPAP
jgi:enoyl-CoA hydratase